MKLKKILLALVLLAVLVAGIILGAYTMHPLKYTEHIRAFSEENGVDRFLVAALIRAESNFDCTAYSKADAKGLMQLTDETAQFCAQKNGIVLAEGEVYNPEMNIRLGVFYLKRMLDLFDGDERIAIAAYNAGEGRVREWLKNSDYSLDGKTLQKIPYAETEKHVEKVVRYKKMYEILYPNL